MQIFPQWKMDNWIKKWTNIQINWFIKDLDNVKANKDVYVLQG